MQPHEKQDQEPDSPKRKKPDPRDTQAKWLLFAIAILLGMITAQIICESLDVTHRTVSDRILAGASQALALHMKAHPAWAGRAVMPRSRKAVREAQGLTARASPKPSFAGLVVRLALTLSV